jgi:hypothetical protein
MATERQIAANLRNGQKSSGPKTEQGKLRSRSNALKHGMTAEVVTKVAEGPEYESRRAAWFAEFRPTTTDQIWAAEKMVASSFKIDRCNSRLDKLISGQADRARLTWDEDRFLEAEVVAKHLGANPPLVVRQLEATSHGCTVMIGRWSRLGEALDANQAWSDAERSLALDLLGLPADLRSGRTPLDPMPGCDPVQALRDLAHAQCDRLAALKSRAHDYLDSHERATAEAGLSAELTKVGQLITRYEREAWSRYHWARRVVLGTPSAKADNPLPAPVPEMIAEATPPPPLPDLDRSVPAAPAGISPVGAVLLGHLMDKIRDSETDRPARETESTSSRVRVHPANEPAGLQHIGSVAEALKTVDRTTYFSGKNRQQRRAERSKARRA